MEIRILAVGKPSRAFADPLADYLKRISRVWPIEVVPVPEQKIGANRSEDDVIRREGADLLARTPEGWPLVAMDRKGKTLSSKGFAGLLRTWRDESARGIAFAIGGPIGLSNEVLNVSRRTLSLGPMTYPHDLALVMLAEQIYRGLTLVQGFPYHR